MIFIIASIIIFLILIVAAYLWYIHGKIFETVLTVVDGYYTYTNIPYEYVKDGIYIKSEDRAKKMDKYQCYFVKTIDSKKYVIRGVVTKNLSTVDCSIWKKPSNNSSRREFDKYDQFVKTAVQCADKKIDEYKGIVNNYNYVEIPNKKC